MSLFSFVPDKKFPTYYDACENTGILKYKSAKIREYGDSYFMEEYQNQYQKTYYEDEPNLRNMAIRRISILKTLFSYDQSGKDLLEIGSAAGFFLDEAKKVGFKTKGYELSGREVEYSKMTLSLDVEQKSILEIPQSKYAQSFDAICAFFVIEHLKDIEGFWSRISEWIRPKGVVFLALPSFFGPSFQTNPQHWFATHPTDHFYDYDLSSLKKLLSILGLDLKYARPMSIHPKRDLGLRGRLPNWGYKLYSNLFCYGDTIEVSFQKK